MNLCTLVHCCWVRQVSRNTKKCLFFCIPLLLNIVCLDKAQQARKFSEMPSQSTRMKRVEGKIGNYLLWIKAPNGESTIGQTEIKQCHIRLYLSLSIYMFFCCSFLYFIVCLDCSVAVKSYKCMQSEHIETIVQPHSLNFIMFHFWSLFSTFSPSMAVSLHTPYTRF